MIQAVMLWTIFSCPILLEKAHDYVMTGFVKKHNNYLYLKVDDAFIHGLYPFLPHELNIQKADYFSDHNPIGTHISIIYPEEHIIIDASDVDMQYNFIIQDLYRVTLNSKEYIVLTIQSPELMALRVKYGLPEKPCFQGIPVEFHITIATSYRSPDVTY